MPDRDEECADPRPRQHLSRKGFPYASSKAKQPLKNIEDRRIGNIFVLGVMNVKHSHGIAKIPKQKQKKINKTRIKCG